MDNNFAVISATVSDRGLSEKRPENEDSFIAIDASGLYAVADGVGGAQAGDVASQMAVEILGEAFTHYGDSVDPEDIMQVALERANEAIYRMSTELPQLSTMATTIAAIHISGNIVTIAHVGDSRVYRVDPEGLLHRETNDHSLVEEEVRAGRMTPEQAANHPSKNVISRALGAEATVAVELKTIMVDPGTSFLICSDGITRHI
ncbi:MAG TPA: protein phosphatase 2C domain-containing protein, partial [Pyrinomonadaceae bacterium]|nr:protein phosphatase 2C domain-containing protein [Pyrinomonadaceae bacterium]